MYLGLPLLAREISFFPSTTTSAMDFVFVIFSFLGAGDLPLFGLWDRFGMAAFFGVAVFVFGDAAFRFGEADLLLGEAAFGLAGDLAGDRPLQSYTISDE